MGSTMVSSNVIHVVARRCLHCGIFLLESVRIDEEISAVEQPYYHLTCVKIFLTVCPLNAFFNKGGTKEVMPEND